MSIEAMKQALEAMNEMEMLRDWNWEEAKDALRQAIEQAEKREPIGYADFHISSIFDLPIGSPLYTTPQPQREWVGTVDCIGLALDLEAQVKRVESQTVERAMLAAANGLRIIDKESKA